MPRVPPPASKLFRIRLQSPIEEWCILSAAQERALLPPSGAAQGEAYRVPRAVAARIFRSMCPPTTNFNLSGRVLEASLDGEVLSQASDETCVRLHGRYVCEHQLWHAPDRNVAEADVDGVLVFESKTLIVTRFALVTDLAIYGDHKGLRVPYVAAAELVPGLHGKRERRAELPPQLACE